MKRFHIENLKTIELGVDEAGRGPLFGRVYAAAVILPKDDSFDHSQMKDSKKFHSKKKIKAVAEYIKTNAVAWAVCFEDEKIIDEINILQATQSAMHKAIKECISMATEKREPFHSIQLLIDGNYFKPMSEFNKVTKKIETVPHLCVEQGDDKYTSIAAASILAKVSRDDYIDELCEQHPELAENYGIDSNKGYGAKKHLEGIKKFGITEWHRKTFGSCKNSS
jgi:ribonuclease HII